MPKLDKRLTDSVALKLPLPTAGTEYHWCKDTPGFGVRVSASGDRAYIFERRVDGKTVRRTLGKAAGAKAISADTARKLKITVSSELQTGVDRLEVKREAAKVEKQEGITLAAALTEYVNGKRRGKDGLGLKDRTKADYLAMVAAGGKAKDGKPFADGALHPLAEKSIYKITADDIRKVYKAGEAKSQRQAIYSMQVLRAVLNWHGAAVADSPLAKATAGKDRIVLAPTKGNPKPIKPEQLGAWWGAASARSGEVIPDACRLIMLTGCRPGEIFGTEFTPGLLVQDVDLTGGRMVALDTKNRKDHTVILSTQALDILRQHCAGKPAESKVFDVIDVRITLGQINDAAGVVGVTPHKLRHTFASIAAKKCSVYELKRMLNHTDTGDVTADHYVDVDDADLSQAWQKVADFIVNKSA